MLPWAPAEIFVEGGKPKKGPHKYQKEPPHGENGPPLEEKSNEKAPLSWTKRPSTGAKVAKRPLMYTTVCSYEYSVTTR